MMDIISLLKVLEPQCGPFSCSKERAGCLFVLVQKHINVGVIGPTELSWILTSGSVRCLVCLLRRKVRGVSRLMKTVWEKVVRF